MKDVEKLRGDLFDEYPGLAHGCILAGLWSIRMILQTIYFCGDLSTQVISMFGNTVAGGKELSTSYYKEVPIRHIRAYYSRISEDIIEAKALRSKMKENDKVAIQEYIKKLEMRVRDVKEIIQEFSEVYAMITEWEDQNDKKPDAEKTDQTEAYLKFDQLLIEKKRATEEKNVVATDYDLIEDNKVMSTLLFLEEHSRKLYEFYATRPNSDAFRCTSLYKTYRIDESEDFKEAIELYDTINSNNRSLVLQNLKEVVEKRKGNITQNIASDEIIETGIQKK